MAFGKLGALGNGFGRLGNSGQRHGGPTTPVLAFVSEAAGAATFTIDVDDTVGAGDSIRLQIQATGGNWSSLVSDTSHTITAPEDAANEIDLSVVLSNATYDARANVTHGGTSGWSNTVTFTITTATSGRLMWGTDQIMWSTDHLTWA